MKSPKTPRYTESKRLQTSSMDGVEFHGNKDVTQNEGSSPKFGEWTFFLLVLGLFLTRFLIPCEFNGDSGDGLPWVAAWSLVAFGGVLWKIRQNRQGQPPITTFSTESPILKTPLPITPSVDRTIPWGFPEWLVTLYFAASAGMILVDQGYGSPRVAMNLCIETAGLWIVFVTFRTLLVRPQFQRWTLAATVSMAIGLSAIAFYQFFDEMPQTRAQYHANPDAALRAAGLWFAPNSSEREQFAQRLESVEPNGPFALTNSLAGVLVPGLVIGISLCFMGWRRKIRRIETIEVPRENKRFFNHNGRLIVAMSLLLFAVFALLLTKSRAGYLAFLMGVGLVTLIHFTERRSWKYLAIGVGIVCILLGVGVAVGGMDREVFSEAKKSLGYRLEYWESTSKMIADYPLTGVGPGNFQSIYTQYKLPWSSEEIADPHNFLMEIGSSYGIPILLLFIFLCGIICVKTLRKIVQLRYIEEPLIANSDQKSSEKITEWLALTLLGLAIGWGLLTVLGAPAENPPQTRYFGIFALVVALATPLWVSMMQRLRHEYLALLLPLIGVTSILINLLAAGGFGMPAMATLFWVLIAMLLANLQTQSPNSEKIRVNRWQNPCFAVLFFSIFIATIQLGLLPNLTMNAKLAIAQSPDCKWSQTVIFCKFASQCDPRSERPWLLLATEAHRLLCNSPCSESADVEVRQIWENAVSQVLRLEPFAARNRRLFAAQAMELSQSFDYRDAPLQAIELQKLALKWYAQAVELYPTLASLRAEYAQALDRSNDSTNAKLQWVEALQLDGITPHKDKKLTEEQRTLAREKSEK